MTFDLEKARKIVGAMSPTPWIVLEDRYGQIDVIRNPNHPMHEEGIIELWGMTSETATPDAIGISYMRSEFPNALDEIERLRASLTDLHAEYINTLEKNPGCSAWDLDEQSIEDQRRLRRNAAHAISIEEPPIYLQADQQATKILELEAISRRRNEIINKQVAKIKDLEEALVEMVATNPCNIPTLCDVVHDELMCPALDGNCDFWKGCPQKNELREAARKQLQAEGKIGNGDHIAETDQMVPCWQIAEERKAAQK